MMLKSGSRPVTGVVVALALGACAKQPEIDGTALAKRSSVEVSASFSEKKSTASGAYTKGEGAKSGALGGGAAGVGIWANELGVYALVLAPGVIVATAVAGAGIGAVSGAAAGTNYTREDIDQAVATVDRSFAPELYSEEFEVLMAAELRKRLETESGPCVAARSERNRCSRKSNRAVLHMSHAFQIGPAEKNASGGHLDFTAYMTFWSEPRGVVTPDCVTLIYRHPAGNLFDLAANDGAGVQASFRRMLPSLSDGLAERLVLTGETVAQKNAAKKTGNWRLGTCDYTTRLLANEG
jgi:hypothetical protein